MKQLSQLTARASKTGAFLGDFEGGQQQRTCCEARTGRIGDGGRRWIHEGRHRAHNDVHALLFCEPVKRSQARGQARSLACDKALGQAGSSTYPDRATGFDLLTKP